MTRKGNRVIVMDYVDVLLYVFVYQLVEAMIRISTLWKLCELQAANYIRSCLIRNV